MSNLTGLIKFPLAPKEVGEAGVWLVQLNVTEFMYRLEDVICPLNTPHECSFDRQFLVFWIFISA